MVWPALCVPCVLVLLLQDSTNFKDIGKQVLQDFHDWVQVRRMADGPVQRTRVCSEHCVGVKGCGVHDLSMRSLAWVVQQLSSHAEVFWRDSCVILVLCVGVGGCRAVLAARAAGLWSPSTMRVGGWLWMRARGGAGGCC